VVTGFAFSSGQATLYGASELVTNHDMFVERTLVTAGAVNPNLETVSLESSPEIEAMAGQLANGGVLNGVIGELFPDGVAKHPVFSSVV
jgi:hypothetical protein